MTDCNCLHCKISAVIIDHFRAEQSLPADQYPSLGSEEVVTILNHTAQVVADTIMPCEQGHAQMLRRVGLFSSRVVQFALAYMGQPADGTRPEGIRLQ